MFDFSIDEWEYTQRCYTVLPKVINKLADKYCSTGWSLLLDKLAGSPHVTHVAVNLINQTAIDFMLNLEVLERCGNFFVTKIVAQITDSLNARFMEYALT